MPNNRPALSLFSVTAQHLKYRLKAKPRTTKIFTERAFKRESRTIAVKIARSGATYIDRLSVR